MWMTAMSTVTLDRSLRREFKTEVTTAVCSYCKKRFRLRRRSNHRKLSEGSYHEATRYCSPAHRQAAYRARSNRNAVAAREAVGATEPAKGTTLLATVTRPLESVEKTQEFQAIKTVEPHPLLVRDERYPEMWRVRLPDGELSDMVNYTRAREAARIVRDVLARQDSAPWGVVATTEPSE